MNAKHAAEGKALDAIAEAGANLGLWIITKARGGEVGWCQWVEVTRGGIPYDLRTGSKDGAATMKPHTILCDGSFRVSSHDLRGVTFPEASASLDRDPAAAAKSLHKRVCMDPQSAMAYEALGEELKRRKESRDQLVSHVDALKAVGATCYRGIAENEYSSADLSHRSLHELRVSAQGSVCIKGYVTMEQALQILAILKA